VLKVRDGRAVEHGSDKKRSGFFVRSHSVPQKDTMTLDPSRLERKPLQR
jgi:hypothetical protein